MAGTLKAWAGGLVVAALVAAAGYGLYMGAQDRGDADVQVKGVVIPYVAANVANDHAVARERYTTPGWKARHSLDDLTASYRVARDEHGGVTGFRLFNTQTGYAPGGEDELNIRGFIQFGDGAELPVTFMLIEAAAGEWLIERSWTRGSGRTPRSVVSSLNAALFLRGGLGAALIMRRAAPSGKRWPPRREALR